jgi:hypothetical protein
MSPPGNSSASRDALAEERTTVADLVGGKWKLLIRNRLVNTPFCGKEYVPLAFSLRTRVARELG